VASSRQSQTRQIVDLLSSRNGAWVSLLEILELKISQYSARIHELRRCGVQVENKTEWRDGKRCSWFRLVECDSGRKIANLTSRPNGHEVAAPQLGLGINLESEARHWEHD
jgi:Helix-turn-helix domain